MIIHFALDSLGYNSRFYATSDDNEEAEEDTHKEN